MPFLVECTHLSILPHTRTLQATGVPDPWFLEQGGLAGGPVRGTEFVRALEDDEVPTTVYDGLVE